MVGMTGAELMNVPEIKRNRICGPWLLEGDLVMLFAARGLTKTFLTLKLLHSVCSWASFLKWRGHKAYKCIYFDGEMGEQQLVARMNLIESTADTSLTSKNLKIVSYEHTGGQMWNLSHHEHQNLYDREARGFDLIVIDNLLTCSRNINKYDDDFEQWERTKAWMLRKRAEGVAVLLLHHAGKNGTQLGTSQRENILDTVIELVPSPHSRPENGTAVEWRFTKARNFFGKDAEDIHVSIETNSTGTNFRWNDLATIKKARVLELHAMGLGLTAIGEDTKLSRSQVFTIINENKKPGPEDLDDMF
jgi:predicted ATP-dependent serine protease